MCIILNDAYNEAYEYKNAENLIFIFKNLELYFPNQLQIVIDTQYPKLLINNC